MARDATGFDPATAWLVRPGADGAGMQATPDAGLSDAERDRFIASLAHEVRTPLTAVVGMLELLVSGVGTPEEDRTEFLGIARAQAIEVGRVLDDLLAAIRLSTDSLTLRVEAVDVDAVLREAIDVVTCPPGKTLHMFGSAGRGDADRTYLAQVVRALLKNAVKFASSSVTVRSGQVAGTIVVDVANDGPPIPVQRVETMFTPYVTDGRAGDNGSLGLGLAVARQLARRMGGDVIHLQARDEVVFRVTVPGCGGDGPEAAVPGRLGAVQTPSPAAVVPHASPVVQVSEGEVAGFLTELAGPLDTLASAAGRLMPSMPPNTLLFVVPDGPAGGVGGRALDRVVAVIEPNRPDAVAVAASVRRGGGLVACGAQADRASLERVRPDFLMVTASVFTGGAHNVSEVVALSTDLDAWVIATDVSGAGEFAAARDAGVPLACGPYVGTAGEGWPAVSPHARAAALRSPMSWSPDEVMANLVGSGSGPVDAGTSMTALAGDRIDRTLERAIRRERNVRFTPVAVIDSAGRTLDVVTVEGMVESILRRVLDRPPTPADEEPHEDIRMWNRHPGL